MPKLSILIAVYNEQEYIQQCLERVLSEKLSGWTKEIIVVDDGSTDKSLENIKQFTAKHTEIKLIQIPVNRGKGAAIKKAAAVSTGDVLIIQDADLEYDPQDYHTILAAFKNKQTKVVYGSRILGSKYFTNRSSHVLFYVGGRLLSFFISLIYQIKLTDQPTCYKSWKKELTAGLLTFCHSDRFAFEVEMTAYFAKVPVQITEVPIHYYPRTMQMGKKIGPGDFISSLGVAIWCIFRKK